MSLFKHIVFYAKKNPLKYLIRLNSTTPANEYPALNGRTTPQEYPLHIPVMLKEVMEFLVDDPNCADFKVYIDMTFGAGGHTRAILERNPRSVVYALDRDPNAFRLAQALALEYPERLFPINSKFSDVGEFLSQLKVAECSIDGALIDCGASSIQFDTTERGFSVSRDGPLDMRMGCNNQGITAEDLVNKLDEESLGKIIWKYGEERMYKKIAHGIVYFRNAHGPIKTTKQLGDVLATIIKQSRSDSTNRPAHVATKTFQALRVFVNNELNELSNGIAELHAYLKPKKGRLAVISFHSLEDRIAKSHFNDANFENDSLQAASSESERRRKNKLEMNKSLDLDTFANSIRNLWTPVNKKVIVPSDDEIERNPRSRSAKLRIAVKN